MVVGGCFNELDSKCGFIADVALERNNNNNIESFHYSASGLL